MQEHRLPKVIHHQETNKNSHILGFKNRQRKALIYKKYDWIQNASGERNLSHLQQIINISLNNLNTIKKKRNLFTQIQSDKSNSVIQMQNTNKKIFIIDRKDIIAKQNQQTDLKTFKSCLNPKTKIPKRVLVINNLKKMQSSHEYIDRHAQSLWEISVNQPCTDILKSAKKDDFEIQPWNNNEQQKENGLYKVQFLEQ